MFFWIIQEVRWSILLSQVHHPFSRLKFSVFWSLFSNYSAFSNNYNGPRFMVVIWYLKDLQDRTKRNVLQSNFSMFFFVIHCQTKIANLWAYYELKGCIVEFFWNESTTVEIPCARAGAEAIRPSSMRTSLFQTNVVPQGWKEWERTLTTGLVPGPQSIDKCD